MVSIVVHEISQPLAATGSGADLCVRGLDDLPRAQDLVGRIQQQALRAGDIVWRTQEVAAGIVSWFAYDEHRDVRFEVEVPADLPPVLADSVQIEQVLINLIRNDNHLFDRRVNSCALVRAIQSCILKC